MRSSLTRPFVAQRKVLLVVLTLGLFWTPLTSKGQVENYQDSINWLVKNADSDSAAIKALFNWDEEIFYTQPALGAKLNERVVDICSQYLRKTGDTTRNIYTSSHILALENQGSYYREVGDFKRCLELYEEGLTLCKAIYRISGDPEDLYAISSTLSGIGTIQAANKSYATAQSYFEEAAKISMQSGDTMLLAESYSNIAYVQKATLDNFIGAAHDSLLGLIMQNNRAALAYRRVTNEYEGIAQSYNNIGALYTKLGVLDSAMYYTQASLKANRAAGVVYTYGYCYANIANLYYDAGNIEMAEIYADSALTLARETDYPIEYLAPSSILHRLYKEKGQWREALEMHELNRLMADSLRSENNERSALEQEARYQYEKKEAILQEQKRADAAKLEAQQAEIQNEQNKKYFLLGGLVLVALFLTFMIRKWRQSQRQNQIIAKQKSELETTHLHLEERNKEVMDSINYAEKIQSAILKSESQKNLPSHFVMFKPKDIVSGDFYWFRAHGDYQFMAVADCTGHGVPGAFMSMLGVSFLNQIVTEGIIEPGKILDELRRRIIRELSQTGKAGESKDGMDISLVRLSTDQREVSWAGANNPLWVLTPHTAPFEVMAEHAGPKAISFQEDSDTKLQLVEIRADKEPIGYHASATDFTNHQLKLQHGDRIYLFSDGFVDQFGGPKGKKFKSRNFKTLLLTLADQKIEDQEKPLDQAFEDWRGSLEQIDDVCVMGLKV